MNIALTGFMGTGKTVVGRQLAKRLGWQYVDVDAEIEKQVGMSISDIFARNGEPYFRDAETNAIKMLGLINNAVIACGGGAVLREENIEVLEKNGIVVCLKATAQTIYERTKHNKTRPLLQVADPLKKIQGMLVEREPKYRRCSVSIDTDDKSVDEIVDEIVRVANIR